MTDKASIKLDHVTVIVPTYNMAEYLPRLWASIRATGLPRLGAKVLFVNDGSTDSTLDALKVIRSQRDAAEYVEVLDLPANQGRFLARYSGAKAASTSHLLFIDTRIELPANFGALVMASLARHPFVIGNTQIDTSQSVYSLYWDISHRYIFHRHFSSITEPTLLTPENYDAFLKGTTVLLTPKDLFLRHCHRLAAAPPLNDDTLLLKEMVFDLPLMIDPELRFTWEPRQRLWPFLLRLLERGPSFAEYHLFRTRGRFFWIVMAIACMLVAWCVTVIFAPWAAFISAMAAIVLATATIFPMTRDLPQGFRLAGLHLLVILSFGIGVLYGVYVNARRMPINPGSN